MAKLQPFRAFRPRPGLEEKISSPPYDVIDSNEARTLAKDNPYSFLHVIKPEIDLPPDIDPYHDRVYLKAKENLDRLISRQWLIRDSKPSFYLYAQKMGEHRQIGLVAGASVMEYETDLIKKHEYTRKDKEDDRTRHVDTVNANTGPVFLTYRSRSVINDAIDRIVQSQEPVYRFTAPDKVQHTVWKIDDDKQISLLLRLFREVPAIYVADGHHRSASAARVKDIRRMIDPDPTGEKVYDYFLAVLFPHDQLKIMDYNRVVKDLNGLTFKEFMNQISESFEITETKAVKPDRPRTFTMYINRRWYRLVLKKDISRGNDPVDTLDVSILQNRVLSPVLGINDPRTDKRIMFIGGIRGLGALKEKVDSFENGVAFALYPTSIDQLMAIADAGKVMPPKSTWFEPKLRSGLIVRSLENI